jgi:ATP/maltotriose-dependent transcriptional regulator MalT/DNA-binding SARP family transcriptional activator
MSGPPEDVGMTQQPVIFKHPAGTTPDPGVTLPHDTPGSHPSGLAIIGSKISPAAPARSVMARPRLVDWFEQQARARLILVSAEAGYGKSTLLNEFALQTRDTCVWYRMETSDRDWITFLSYMVAALRDYWPTFGRSTEALLRNVAAMGSSREVVLGQFLADLGSVDGRRVAVILDDYHLVEDSPDIRMILSRLLERAPDNMYFILGGRGVPNLALGRLLAQGGVSELTIDDLRFTYDEIDELFSTTYGQPLDTDACRIIAERTEGWAASLQLVSASIAVSQPSEIASFIHALSGATGGIYDFLAEEVLTRLSSTTQRILMRAALVDRVRAEYVSAALDACDTPAAPGDVDQALDEAEALGLLGARGPVSGGRRIHPLFREFLLLHLDLDEPTERIREMHQAIARRAESLDWLVAAKHYALAGESAEGMRVLGSAASEALGTGAWGTAVEIIDLMPDTSPPAAVKVIQARALISDDLPDEAYDLLDTIDRSALSPEERGLVGLTSAAVHHMNGESERLKAEVEAIASDTAIPSPLHEVAVSWRQILLTAAGGCITDAVRMLRRMAVGQRQAGLHYFAGVTLHNTAHAELARANYQQACELAAESIAHLERTDDGVSISASTRATSAAAVAEMGDIEEGLRLASASASEPDATADTIADAAFMHGVCGRLSQAQTLLAKFDRGDSRWSRELGARGQGLFARIALYLSEGRPEMARTACEKLEALEPEAIDAPSRTAVVAAMIAILDDSPTAASEVRRALEVTSSQNAWRWMARARILDAVVRRDAQGLRLWISESENDSALALFELADVIATAIGILAPLPEALERSILREPARWVPALARQVRGRPSDDASAAASLVARFGGAGDAALLRDFERSRGGRPRKKGLATKLIRRVSPTCRVHDLGLTSFEVGDRQVALTETRRKPAALLLYLATRPGLVAPREQAMDSLRPDQSPKSASNSLHQTLFFLRRDIEPWYEDGSTADYVHMESDVVRLDPDLFQIDSIAFARQASDIFASHSSATRGPELLALYHGRFAPEFEYEDWAEEWRTHLHTTYLRLAHSTASALLKDGRYADVVEMLAPVAALDPTAFDLRSTLVGCLAIIGATDAAQAHYRSMALAHERDLGLPARPYAEIVDTIRGVL